MQQIPLSADSCRGYVGKHVCAVLQDGTEVVGTLRGVHDKGLEIEFVNPTASVLSAKGKQGGPSKKSKSSKGSKAATSAFGPGYGYGYGGYSPYWGGGNFLAWEAIALLFLIPFLFI
ncbi:MULTISPECIES: hypothetical protein [Paenibacillus]|uniref:Uncharacterized protein n=1 Tax=Paenibacillus campinasensis TaxID=66347 RepID=A0A268EPX8_9BACL|nr:MULTISPECIES: hypothetical protein [Paenibacillus]MUG67501.1 hypothetical protein [Paenibacillus campinasensis]PAD75177.1 hypothetical protein CHH67_16295 [Paenibacillus campinasensis]PAK50519.1 hypothetical protein CHH75_17885 [Paenibacillus sp. 7541]